MPSLLANHILVILPSIWLKYKIYVFLHRKRFARVYPEYISDQCDVGTDV